MSDSRNQQSLNYLKDENGKPIVPAKGQELIAEILGPKWLVEAEGAKRAGKDVWGCFGWAAYLDQSENKFHLAIATSESQAQTLILDADGFGVKHHFPNGKLGKGLDDAVKNKITYKFKDSVGRDKVIIFVGGAEETSFKSFRGVSVGSAYINEANLLHINTLNEAKDRTIASKHPKIVITQNPDNPSATYYTDFEEAWQKKTDEYFNDNINGIHDGPDFKYILFTAEDNPIFDEYQLERIKNSFTSEKEKKKHFYGVRIATEGLVYDMFDDENLYGNPDDEKRLTGQMKERFERYIGVDVGYTNTHVYLSAYYDRITGDLWIDDEWLWNSKEEGKYSKSPVDYAIDLKKFIKKNGLGNYKYVLVDPSAKNFIGTIKQFNIRVKKVNNAVGTKRSKARTDEQKADKRNNPTGIPLIQTGLALNKIMVNRRCLVTIKEFDSYVWDQKAKERGEEKPLKVNDHCMDALRYIVNTIIANERKWVKKIYDTE